MLEKSGENVQAVPVAKRMKVKDLGELNPDGSSASLIDVLHRMCVFREMGDTAGVAGFLARSGQGGNSSLWLVAQAVSEILPDGEKEKQLMQGLLNQREQLQSGGQARLFWHGRGDYVPAGVFRYVLAAPGESVATTAPGWS